MIETLALLIGFFYLGYLFAEKRRVVTYRSSFSHVIHVSGTRGKTTVTRMIGHLLRQEGVRVFTKVSGTIPTYIDTEGREHVIKRLGLANIREQIRMMRRAYNEKADVLVIECMAIKEEYVRVTQHEMLRADYVVITNVLKDHLEDENRGQAHALLAAVPKQGNLFIRTIDQELFEQTARNNETNLSLVEIDVVDQNDAFGNAAFAQAIIAALGYVTEGSLKDYPPDIGAFSIYRYRNMTLINAFSVNDRSSFERMYEMLENKNDVDLSKATFLINNRSDRPKRALEFLDFLKTLEPIILYVAGPFHHRFQKALKRSEVRRYRSPESLEGSLVIGIGNIHSAGYDVIEYFKKGEKIHG